MLPRKGFTLSQDAGLMLTQRLRRWPNIKPALAYSIVYPGSWHRGKPGFCLDRSTIGIHVGNTPVKHFTGRSPMKTGGDSVEPGPIPLSGTSHRALTVGICGDNFEFTQL